MDQNYDFVIRRPHDAAKKITALLKELEHCKALLDHCTYHDGRYEQCANSDYQKDCCATSDRIERHLQGVKT